MRSLISFAAVLVTLALTPLAAFGKGRPNSCGDVNGVIVCCRSWVIHSRNAKGVEGALLEDSYDALIARLERARDFDRFLCDYFKDDTCTWEYGPPQCSGCAGGGAFAEAKAEVALATADALKPKLRDIRRTVSALTAGAAKSPRLKVGRNPFTNVGKVLEEYEKTVDAAKGRAGELAASSGVANDCQAATPFGCLSRADPRALFFTPEGFAGPAEVSNDSCAQAQAMRELKAIADQLEALSTIEPVSFGGPFTSIRTTQKTGGGTLLFGESGELLEGTLPPDGEMPVVFVSSTGAVAPVKVTKSRQGLLTTTTIRASAGGSPSRCSFSPCWQTGTETASRTPLTRALTKEGGRRATVARSQTPMAMESRTRRTAVRMRWGPESGKVVRLLLIATATASRTSRMTVRMRWGLESGKVVRVPPIATATGSRTNRMTVRMIAGAALTAAAPRPSTPMAMGSSMDRMPARKRRGEGRPMDARPERSRGRPEAPVAGRKRSVSSGVTIIW